MIIYDRYCTFIRILSILLFFTRQVPMTQSARLYRTLVNCEMFPIEMSTCSIE